MKLLKPGAPILLYIYYSLDNRPIWFKILWNLSNFLRLIISRLPKFLNFLICDMIAILIYYPIAKISLFFEKIGINSKNFLTSFLSKIKFLCYAYRFRDRFGSPMEKRYSKKEINIMMKDAEVREN